MHLEHDLTVRRHRDAISVGQRQLLGVVQDGVEVLDPDGVDWTIENQPHVVTYDNPSTRGYDLNITAAAMKVLYIGATCSLVPTASVATNKTER